MADKEALVSGGDEGNEERKPNVKARNWKFVLYEDSAGPDWLGKLEELCWPLVVSPVHDHDVKKDGSGELVKPHRHVLVTFSAGRYYSAVLEALRAADLGVSIVKLAGDVRSEERYLCHLDSPVKWRYDVADLIPLGGYKIRFCGERFEMSGLQQIHDLIEELGIVHYCDLANEIVVNHPELLGTFLRYPAHWNNFCYSRLRFAKKLAPDNKTYVNYAMGRKKFGR